MAANAHPADAFAPRVVTDAAAELERRALDLRTAGKTYASIARELGLAKAKDAHEIFSRAVRGRPQKERTRLRAAECERLDALARKAEERADLSPDQRRKRLRSIERLRQTLMMD
jgi:hypothetical protein